ncbi:MAG: hypothetical protein IKO10_01670 [Lachnospiraceae bacterium]|nr:hypothetical protein [Lachnospiraceae bacterium]
MKGYWKDYFRQERTIFRNAPYMWGIRIMFVVVLLCSGRFQWCVMLTSGIFSVGFYFSSEAEYLLPLTEKEWKTRRLTRVCMIWLRYLLLGILSYVLWVGLGYDESLLNTFRVSPLMCVAFFVLQMLMVFGTLLEQVIDSERRRKPSLVMVLPFAAMFYYWIHFIPSVEDNSFFAATWQVDILIITAAGLIEIVRCVRMFKRWKKEDYDPAAEKVKALQQV